MVYNIIIFFFSCKFPILDFLQSFYLFVILFNLDINHNPVSITHGFVCACLNVLFLPCKKIFIDYHTISRNEATNAHQQFQSSGGLTTYDTVAV